MSKYMNFSEKYLKVLGILDFTGVKWNGAFKITLMLIIYSCFLVTVTNNLVNVMDDLDHLADNLCVLLTAGACYLKFLTLIYYRKKIRLLRNIVGDDEISVVQSENEDYLLIETYAGFALKFTKAYAGMIFISGFGMSLLPLLAIFAGGEYLLPFPAVYPFSTNSAGTFTIAYVHQTVTSCIFMTIFVAYNSWFIFLVHHACDHFCVLQNSLENISEADRHHVQEKIIRCVQLHQNLYKFSGSIEEVFNVSLLMQFGLSSVVICTSGYMVTKNFDEPQVMMNHGPIVVSQILELLIFNWCGQLMEEKNIGVSLAISRSKFYQLKIQHQKDLKFVSLRAQKPAYLTAGKFYNLSLLNFTNLMKASFSYFTMLTSFDEK